MKTNLITTLTTRRHHRTLKTGGFSLVEALVSVIIVAIAALGIISSIIFARSMAEYDKQRIAAIQIARQYVEESQRDLQQVLNPISNQPIDNFNTPEGSDDLLATVDRRIYAINLDGTRGAELFVAPSAGEMVEVEVTVSWNRTGRRSSKRVSESLTTYASTDTNPGPGA